MPTARAERRLRRRVLVGCEANVYSGELTVAFAGGHPDQSRHLIGGDVWAFAVKGRKYNVGVFDCL